MQTVDDFRAQDPGHPCAQLDGGLAFLRCLDDKDETEVAQAYRALLEALPPGIR